MESIILRIMIILLMVAVPEFCAAYSPPPNCPTSGGTQALNYSTSSNSFSCNAVIGSASGVTSVTGDSVIFNNAASVGAVTLALINQTKNTFLSGPTSGANTAPTFRTISGSDLPNPSASTLGGIESYAAITHQFINTISTSGVPSSAQAACADLSNSSASCSTDATNASNISSGTLASARGGAGSISGALKGSGAGVVSQAACSDLSNGATGCSTATGTSGATIPLLNGTNTWSGVQSINSGDLALKGATSGTITLNAAGTAGSNTLTLPAGTTDFSATGGTSQVVKQTSSGGAFTVAQLACSDLSNGATGCSTATGTSGATIPLNNGGNTFSGSNIQSGAYAVTTTNTPTQAGGTLGLAGTATKPTLGANSEGDIFLVSADGLNLIGQGSTNDFRLYNKSGTSVCTVATGTTNLNCTGLQVGGSAVLTSAATTVTNSDGTLTISPTSGSVVASIALGHANTWTAGQAVTPSTVAISVATFTPNLAASNNFDITLVHASCPCTLANPTNIVQGQSGIITIHQSATGSDTITSYGGDYIFTNTTAPTLSTAANSIDYFSYYVEDSTHIRISALISSVVGTTTEGVISTGTKFTMSGCSATTPVGGATAGKYTSGTTGTCTVVITMNGATGMTSPNGWSCWANDETTTADKQQTTSSNTTTATIAGTTISGDVIDFGCIGF